MGRLWVLYIYFTPSYFTLCCTPYSGVFPKWLPVLPGSIHKLIALGPINFMEIGTPVTGPFFKVTVAVPLYVLAIVFFCGATGHLKICYSMLMRCTAI